jgi:hypothetical protein
MPRESAAALIPPLRMAARNASIIRCVGTCVAITDLTYNVCGWVYDAGRWIATAFFCRILTSDPLQFRAHIVFQISLDPSRRPSRSQGRPWLHDEIAPLVEAESPACGIAVLRSKRTNWWWNIANTGSWQQSALAGKHL